MAFSWQQFVSHTREQQQMQHSVFEVEKTCFLRVSFGFQSSTGNPLNQVWIKTGSMVASQGDWKFERQAWMKTSSMVAAKGDSKFEREGVTDHGLSNTLKKQVTDEGLSRVSLTKASTNGRGWMYLADNSKRVTVLYLRGESIFVNGDDLLAFEPGISIPMMSTSIVSGGVFNVRLQGQGFVAISSHGQPLTLIVAPGYPPVCTDPQATVAWSGELVPGFETEVGLKTHSGRESGEAFQFHGQGFVVVQPHEETPAATSSGSSGGRGPSNLLVAGESL